MIHTHAHMSEQFLKMSVGLALALGYFLWLCVFLVYLVCFCCVRFCLVLLAKRLVRKNVSEMTYFVSCGT